MQTRRFLAFFSLHYSDDRKGSKTCGGTVVLYADEMTESIKVAVSETERRRKIQEAFNIEHGIEPRASLNPLYIFYRKSSWKRERAKEMTGQFQGPAKCLSKSWSA